MSEKYRKNIKVKHGNLYFTFIAQSKIRKFIFYFKGNYGY